MCVECSFDDNDVGINWTGRDITLADGGIEMIFVEFCCGQIVEFEFCWITNFDGTVVAFVVVVVDDDGGFVINVTRFFVKKTDGFVFVNDDVLIERSVADEFEFVLNSLFVEIVTLFNVWIFGDVVPGGINVNKGVALLELFDGEFKMNAFDVANVPLLVEFGGEDLPVVGVTKRIDEPVEFLIELSKWESAIGSFFTMDKGLATPGIEIVGTKGFGCNFKPE